MFSPLLARFRRLTGRTLNLAGLVACLGLYGYALFAEQVLGYAPCPLCILQRYALVGLMVVLAIAALHGAAGRIRHLYSALAMLPVCAGASVAGRHLWLQSLPAGQVPPCSAGFGYLIENFGLAFAVREALRASGECAEVDWLLFGITAPAWVLAAFIGFGAWAVYANSVCKPKSG